MNNQELPEDPGAVYREQGTWKGWDDFLGLPEGTHALHEQAEALHEKFVEDLKPILKQLSALGAPRPPTTRSSASISD